MKGIKVLNISFLMIIVTVLYFLYIANTKVPPSSVLIFFIFVFMFNRLFFYLKLRKNNILLKTKLPPKGVKDYFLLFSIGTVSFLLIINVCFSFILTDGFTLIIGSILLFYFIGILNNKIIFSNDYIVFNGHFEYAKWNKIVKFTIYNDILNLETLYDVYNISFNKIPKSEVNYITDILNKKLSKIFNGNLSYENQELKVIENKNC